MPYPFQYTFQVVVLSCNRLLKCNLNFNIASNLLLSQPAESVYDAELRVSAAYFQQTFTAARAVTHYGLGETVRLDRALQLGVRVQHFAHAQGRAAVVVDERRSAAFGDLRFLASDRCRSDRQRAGKLRYIHL